MTPIIDSLYRFPVKGLSPARLDGVELQAGYGFPLDRCYAITDGSWAFDPLKPVPVPKTKFLMLARYERLMSLRTEFDEGAGTLRVRPPDGDEHAFALGDPAGRDAAASFFAAYMGDLIHGTPAVVSAPGHQFTDVSVHSVTLMRSISVINLASVRDLGEKLGRDIDAIRFRGNVVFDSDQPWVEFDWMDRELTIGDAHVRAIRRTRRCPATNVDPATSRRDMDIPFGLRDHYGHGDLGIYVEVLRGGPIRVGDELRPVPG